MYVYTTFQHGSGLTRNLMFNVSMYYDDGLQPRWPKLSGPEKFIGFVKKNVVILSVCTMFYICTHCVFTFECEKKDQSWLMSWWKMCHFGILVPVERTDHIHTW